MKFEIHKYCAISYPRGCLTAQNSPLVILFILWDFVKMNTNMALIWYCSIVLSYY